MEQQELQELNFQPRKAECLFSNQTYNRFDREERARSTKKLHRLIYFYTLVMVAENIGGIKSNSLAVLTDALHLLSDITGFIVSLFAMRVSSWEVTKRQSFGFNRLEVLGALFSIELIWLISGFLIYESFVRILHKNENINGKLMFVVAAFGFIVNFIMVVWLGHDHFHEDHVHETNDEENITNLIISTSPKTLNINIQGAYLHVVTDLIQSIGVMVAGSIIWVKPDWLLVDLLCTLIFSILALTMTLPMLKNIFYILMESTPSDIDIVSLENRLKGIQGVNDVHDLHVWAITSGKLVLICHVVTEPGVNSNEIVHKIRNYCTNTYRIQHVTVQIEQR